MYKQRANMNCSNGLQFNLLSCPGPGSVFYNLIYDNDNYKLSGVRITAHLFTLHINRKV